jgi:hypothetical protein
MSRFECGLCVAGVLLLASCASQPEELASRPPEGCPEAHVAACDAELEPCIKRCGGPFNSWVPPNCLPTCRYERYQCYARCPKPSAKGKP